MPLEKIIVSSVFNDKNKYWPQVYIAEWLFKLVKQFFYCLILICYKMSCKETLSFDKIFIEKCKFNFKKKAIVINGVNTKFILLSDNYILEKLI